MPQIRHRVLFARPVALIAGLCAASLSACSSGSGSATQDSQASSASSYTPNESVNRPIEPAGDERYQALRALGYRLEWTGFAVVPNRREVEYVDVWDDIIAVHESANSLSVIETSTGSLRWNQKLSERIAKFVGTARTSSGDIVSVSETEAYLLDDQSGVLTDRQDLATLANTRPVVDGMMLVVGGTTGELLGHNLGSGFKAWGYQLGGPIRSAPFNVGDAVGAVSDVGEVVVVDPRSGTSIMRTTIYDGIDSRPVASQNLVYIAGRDQSVWAFSTLGGDVRWRVRTEHRLRAQPALHDGRLLIEIPGEGLVSLDAGTGERQWAIPDLGGEVIAERDGRLIVWDGGSLTSVDAGRGGVVERRSLPDVDFAVTNRFVDGDLYLVESGGRIQKYSPR